MSRVINIHGTISVSICNFLSFLLASIYPFSGETCIVTSNSHIASSYRVKLYHKNYVVYKVQLTTVEFLPDLH